MLLDAEFTMPGFECRVYNCKYLSAYTYAVRIGRIWKDALPYVVLVLRAWNDVQETRDIDVVLLLFTESCY